MSKVLGALGINIMFIQKANIFDIDGIFKTNIILTVIDMMLN